jgi:hypothetical protein
MEDVVFVIPYLMSPMGNPIAVGVAALRPLQRQARRLIHRLRAERAARRTRPWLLRPAWDAAETEMMMGADLAGDGRFADLEYQIALACLLLL